MPIACVTSDVVPEPTCNTDHDGTVTDSVYDPANELVEQTATEQGGTAVVTEQAGCYWMVHI